MIGEPTLTTASRLSALDHVTRYEALRDQAVPCPTTAIRGGLVVLLRQGLAAWMDAWSKLPAPPARQAQAERRRQSPLPDGTSAEVVRVLAAMALGNAQEARV